MKTSIKKPLMRGVALSVAVVMAATSMTACSQSPSSTSSTASGSGTTSARADISKEVTLKFYIPGDAPAGKDKVLSNLESLTKSKTNCKFDFNFISFGDYQNKLTMLAASGDNYDAAFTADWFGFSTMVNKGAFMDITKLTQKYAPDLYKIYQEKDMLSSASVGGKLMALPWTQLKTSKPVFAYRKDIADKYNLQPGDLTTIEGIDKFLTAAVKANTGMNTLFDMNIAGSGMKGDIVNLLCPKYEYQDIGYHSLYIDLNDPTCKIVPLEQTPMFKEAVTYAKKWYDEGIINKNAMAEIGTKLFESGKDFSQKNIDERIYEKTAFTDSSAKSAAVEVYPNKKFTRDSQMNNAIAINKNAANPERTLMFMNLISSNEAAYDALMYGIKDVTYSIDSNGQVGYASGESASKPLWQGWNGWGFYRANFAKPTISRPTAAIKQEETFVNRSNIVISPLAGFIPSSDAIKTQLAQRDQIQDEQGKLLLAGIVNGDITTAINEYIKRQKAAGLDQIISDTQSQVNKFLSSKKS